MVYPDQLYVFSLVAAASLSVTWATTERRPALLYALGAACLALIWLRPVGVLPALICLVVALLRRHLLHVAGITAIIVSLHMARSHFYRSDERTMFGRQLFFNPYAHGDSLVEADGPATAQLRSYLIQQLGEIEPLLRAPRMPSFWQLTNAAEVRFIRSPSAETLRETERVDRLFLDAAIEYIIARPLPYAAAIAMNYKRVALGPAWRMGNGNVGSDRVLARHGLSQPNDVATQIYSMSRPNRSWCHATRLIGRSITFSLQSTR
jgi:hypothetical protein